jgi:O-antigen/teichoic acid export membrane protein
MFSFLGGVTVIIVGNIDMLMISSMIGLAETGIYSIAFYVGSVIAIPSRSVSKISLPLISLEFERNNIQEIEKIYKQTSINQYLFGLLIFIGVLANIDSFYLLLPTEYSSGSLVIFVIGTANLVDMITGSCSQIVMCSPFYKFGLYFSILLVILTVVLNFMLIPLYGILGAAIATASAIFLTNTVKVLFVWLKLKIQPLDVKSIYITVIGFSILFLSYQIPSLDNFYIDVIIRSFSIASLYLLLVWFFKLSKEFDSVVKKLIGKIFG